MKTTLTKRIMLHNQIFKCVVFLVLMLSGMTIHAQNWPNMPDEQPCFLIGNFRSLAVQNADGIIVAIGNPSDPATWQSLGSNWSTDANGVLCLNQNLTLDPPHITVIVSYNDWSGYLTKVEEPIIFLHEKLDMSLFETEAEEDDYVGANGGIIDLTLDLREDQLKDGPVKVNLQTANNAVLFSRGYDEQGELIDPQPSMEVTIENDEPVRYYVQTINGFAYDHDPVTSFDTIMIEAVLVETGSQAAGGKGKEQEYSVENTTVLGQEDLLVTDQVVLYRGVNVSSPKYTDVTGGVVMPKNWGKPVSHASPRRHTIQGTNESVFTSWSMSELVSASFATVPHDGEEPGQVLSTEGTLLKRMFKKSELTRYTSGPSISEQEILIIGPVADAIDAKPVDATDYPPNLREVFTEYANNNNELITKKLNALGFGHEYPAMPAERPCFIVARKFGDVVPSVSGIKAWLLQGGGETPLLNNGINNWSTNENGELCLDQGGDLSADQQVRIEVPYLDDVISGVSDGRAIIFLDDNPYNLSLKRRFPDQGAGFFIKDKIKPYVIGGGLRVTGTHDEYGIFIDFVDDVDGFYLVQFLQEFKLYINEVEFPIWNGVDDLDREFDEEEAAFLTYWTPPGNGDYKFKMAAVLTSGEVLWDDKPFTIRVNDPQASNMLSFQLGQPTFNAGANLSLSIATDPADFTFNHAYLQSDAVFVPQDLALEGNGVTVEQSLLGESGLVLFEGGDQETPLYSRYRYNYHKQGLSSNQRISLGAIQYSFASGLTDLLVMEQGGAATTTGIPQEHSIIGPVYHITTSTGTPDGSLIWAEQNTLDVWQTTQLAVYRWSAAGQTWVWQQAINNSLEASITDQGVYALVAPVSNTNTSLRMQIASPAAINVNTANELSISYTQTTTGPTVNTVQYFIDGEAVGNAGMTYPHAINWTPSSDGIYYVEAYATLSDGSLAYATEYLTVLPQTCQSTLTLMGTLSLPSFSADLSIQTMGEVSVSPGNVVMLNSRDIILSPGFTASQGADLTCWLAGCDGNPLARTGDASVIAMEQTSTGLSDSNKNTLLSVWPNPFASKLLVKIKLEDSKEVNVAIYDLQGNKINDMPRDYLLSPEDSTIELDMSSLSPGLYILTIESGAWSESRRIIKQ